MAPANNLFTTKAFPILSVKGIEESCLLIHLPDGKGVLLHCREGILSVKDVKTEELATIYVSDLPPINDMPLQGKLTLEYEPVTNASA